MAFVLQYRPGAVLQVGGDDAASFLQGQFTNELRQATGRVVYGLFLNQKGKVVADAQILRLAEKTFLIESDFSSGDIIRQRLEEYIVADDVSLRDETAAWHGLALWGNDCGRRLEPLLGGPLPAGQFMRSGEALVFAGRRMQDENYAIIAPAADIHRLRGQLLASGCLEAGAGAAEFDRIVSGQPAIPGDLGPGDLPNEGGLEDVAISYTKGCYLGQEVMARLKNMGQVRRRLHVVLGADPAPAARAPLYQRGVQCGEIRSVASRDGKWAGLAMLRLLQLDPAAGLSLAPGAPAEIAILPHG
jgi:folate-binding protein YgfZ